jgi:tRNA threonylcarbamoyladenosine biosynthesis protein TsaE
MTIVTHSADETRFLGEQLGQLLQPGDIVLLHGDLGAGKTTLTQGMAQGLGITDPVQSPTFTLVHQYDRDDAPFIHLDLYRLDKPDELESIGYDDLMNLDDAIVVMEWPERAGDNLPESYLLIHLEPTGPDERTLTISAYPKDGPQARIVNALGELRAAEFSQ